MAADNYGNYTNPIINTWDCLASQDHEHITPEPTDGLVLKYMQDDNMIQGCMMPLLASISCGNVKLTERSNGCICFAGIAGLTFLLAIRHYFIRPTFGW